MEVDDIAYEERKNNLGKIVALDKGSSLVMGILEPNGIRTLFGLIPYSKEDTLTKTKYIPPKSKGQVSQ